MTTFFKFVNSKARLTAQSKVKLRLRLKAKLQAKSKAKTSVIRVFTTHFFALALLLGGVLNVSFAASNQVKSVRVWPSPDSTRVVFDLTQKPDYSYFFLTKPDRLVIDIKNAKSGFSFDRLTHKSKLIKKVRYSKPEYKNSQRIVLDLFQALQAGVFALPPVGRYGNRLVIDLAQPATTKNTQPDIKKMAIDNRQRDIVVAIDAGHGGEDPGSIGPSGLYEKKVTYQISKKLVDKLNKEPGIRAYMVRTGDYYIEINRRSVIARQKKADLLLSIHADAFTTPKPNGGSVWMLSLRRANTEIGRWIEQREQQSELLGGAGDIIKDTANEKYLAKALLDMSMDHSIVTSYDLSKELIKQMSKVTRMHKKKPQTASLGVLKSPDIPSILIEVGFISNPTEERRLNQKDHQLKLANSIATAVKNYYSRNPPDGTLFAHAHKNIQQHTVQRGESLSRIAKRYAISISALKSANGLKSDRLLIGQILKIPNVQ